MIVSHSNCSVFASLATDMLGDVHAVDPAGRAIPRSAV